jgi:hypothetical protein
MVESKNAIIDSLQLEYDTQSNHGLVTNMQALWIKGVDSCLMSLLNYSNPVIAGK